MIQMYINKSNATHILTHGSSPFGFSVRPNEIFDRRQTDIPVERLPWFEPFYMTSVLNANEVTLIREYALGDLIQLIPIARQLKKINNKHLNIATTQRFVGCLRNMFEDLNFITTEKLNCAKLGIKIHLNGILERDHSLNNPDRNLHRVDIYSKFFGLKVEELDWSLKMQNTPEKMFFKENEKVIALQIRGSGAMKTLPHDFIKKIAFAIVQMGYKVLLIDQDKGMGFDGENIINACGKMDVIDIVTNLQKCKCVITMDSGVLWLAHVANCPVLTFLGSTREAERMSLHPQYPEKARSINLSEHVGCTPCFETRVRCKGSIDCMNKFNRDTILKEVIQNLKIILKGDENGQKEETDLFAGIFD